MGEDELKALDKDVRRLKRISQEWAAKLHDLVEEGLPGAYEELPALAQSTFDACRAWAEAERRLTGAITPRGATR
jgi:hypothetical protein